MPLPTPKNCRLDNRCEAFVVEINGRQWNCRITLEAVADLYPGRDPVQAVSESSLITRKVAEFVRSGDVEPIFLNSMHFR